MSSIAQGPPKLDEPKLDAVDKTLAFAATQLKSRTAFRKLGDVQKDGHALYNLFSGE